MKYGVILLGAAGYMGKNGLSAIADLQRAGHDVDLVAVTEHESRTAAAKLAMRRAGIRSYEHVPVFTDIGSALSAAEAYRNYPLRQTHLVLPIFVYDASPTHHHPNNLGSVAHRALKDVFYLGEKPIFTDPGQLLGFEAELPFFPVFCDFSELGNPSFLATKDVLDDLGLEIREIWHWRAGSQGTEKFLGEGRGGVEGGALLDKAVHDIAVSTGLLSVADITDFDILDAKFHCMMLDSIESAHAERPTTMGMDGEIGCSSAEEVLWALKGDEGQTRGKLPADALTTFDVEWKLSGDRTVTAHYLCSWIGTGAIPSVESAFRNLLAGAQIEGEDNLLWHDVTRDQLIGSQSQLYRFDREDVRLTVVECADRRTGRIHTIVFNMLAGKNGPSDPPELRRPERWAWRVVPDGMGRVIKEKLSLEVANEEILSLANSDSRDYRKSRLRDLARIFGSAASSGIYGHDSMISRDAVMLVHRVLLEVQETALANLAATDEEFTGMLNTSFEILMSRASRIESASQS